MIDGTAARQRWWTREGETKRETKGRAGAKACPDSDEQRRDIVNLKPRGNDEIEKPP
jgi:hypothetical protein